MSETRRDWKTSLIIWLGAWLIRALAVTWRYRIVNDAGYRTIRANHKAFIFAFWHGQMLPLLWTHRGEGVAIVISSHRDGEIIAGIADRMGYRTVRGSSTRGGS